MKKNLFCIVLLFLFMQIDFAQGQKLQNPGLRSGTSIVFMENKGQMSDQSGKPRPDVLFAGAAGDIIFHLRNNGISYQFYRVEKWAEKKDEITKKTSKSPGLISVYRLDINWVNTNKQFATETENSSKDFTNYYLESCPKGVHNVKTYGGITYKNIYNNIDLHYYEKDGALKYDYVAGPGADYNQIKMKIAGATKISLNEKGELVIKTPYGNIIEEAPLVKQSNKLLKARWTLTQDVLGYDIENLNENEGFVIDPLVRAWGTYYGGSGDESGKMGCTTDNSGNIYFVGSTSTTGSLMATSGAHQTTFGSSSGAVLDAFIGKFDGNGSRVWATYYGGTDTDEGRDCVVDAGGNVYLAGFSRSSESVIVTAGAQQTVNSNGSFDAMLIKFNSSGVRQWGTYYGGTLQDLGISCTTDPSGNIYLAGQAFSTNSISTSGSHQTTHGGGSTDGFLAKFNSSGARQWCTYYGGSGFDEVHDCITDATGNVYIVGPAQSTAAIASSGAFQTTYAGGVRDAFLAKFNSNGVRQWGTYYGDSGDDFGESCATDAAGNVYIAAYMNGGLSSSTVLATPGSHQPVSGSSYEAMLAKFNTNGAIIWGTYYGGIQTEVAYACATDAASNVYLAGYNTGGSSVIATPGSYQTSSNGNDEAFCVKFNSNGVRQWGTFYGASGSDMFRSCTIDNTGALYLVGNTGIGSSLASPGAYQTSANANFDFFIVKFTECPPDVPTNISSSTAQNICANQSTTLSAAGSGTVSWYASATSTVVLGTGASFVTPTLSAGTYSYYAEAVTCSASASRAEITVTVNPPPVISIGNFNICSGNTITFTPTGACSYTYSSGSAAVTPTASTSYSIYGSSCFGCISAAPAVSNVTVNTTPTVSVNSGSICMGQTFTMSPSGASTYTFSSGSQTVSPATTTNYAVTGTGTNGCISLPATANVTVQPLPVISVNSGTICNTKSFTIIPSGASTYTVTGNNFTVSPTTNTSYSVTGTSSAGCLSSNTAVASVTVYSLPVVSVNSGTSCAGNNFTILPTGALTYTVTGNNFTVNPASTSSYSVTGSSSVGCLSSNTAIATVTVYALPVITVNSGSICATKIFTIVPNGALSYSVTGGSFTVSPSTTNVYSVTGTSTAGCVSASAAVSLVNVVALPVLSISASSSTVCSSDAVILTASGASSYSWNTGVFTPTLGQNPVLTTIYSVTGTNTAGCAAASPATIQIFVNATPTITVSGPPAICAGTTATLTATGANTYIWNTSATGPNATVNPVVATSYTVIGTSAANCSAQGVYNLSVNPLPSVSISGTTAICIGGSVTLTGSGAFTYTWTNNIHTTSFTAAPTANTIYTLGGTNTNGCYNSASITVVVNPLPTVTINSTASVVCQGDPVTLSGVGATTYSWTGGVVNNTSFVPVSSGSYTVTGADANGCQNVATTSITVNSLPSLTTSPSATICEGEGITLTVGGASTYTWNTTANTTSIAVSPTAAANYTVTGTGTNGCSKSSVISVKVDPCTGLKNTQANDIEFSVYPNPANGEIFITMKEWNGNTQIELYNAIGQLIHERSVSGERTALNVENYASGIYFLRVSQGDNLVRQIRIVKMD